MYMAVRMVTPLLCISLLLSGCEKDSKKITAEPVRQSDQPKAGSSTGASSDRPKQPPVRQPQERREQKEAMRDNRKTAPKQSRTDSPRETPSTEQRPEEQTAGISPNNGGRAVRKQPQSVTPLDQSGSAEDLAVTQRIRQALLREDLSFAAKNILVITDADHVVLKGQVRSPSEAERIKGIAGTITTKRIEDVLEVTP